MDWGILENETEGVRIAGDKMLTKRQYSILSFYVENRGTYVSSNELAAMFDISVHLQEREPDYVYWMMRHLKRTWRFCARKRCSFPVIQKTEFTPL